jgi:tetratricopeptide (TPR) repeat protein
LGFEALFEKAIKHHVAGELDEASALYEDLLCRHPNDARVLFGLATVFSQAGRNGIAIALFLQSIQRDPKNAEALANLGVCLRSEGHVKSALEAYHESLKINPNSAETISNIAGCYVNAGEPGLCLEWAERALKINPQSPQAGNHKALALMEMGRWKQGWAWYDSRLRLPTWHSRPYACPLWEGEQTDVLSIHGEQGLGDEIMLLAYVEEAKKRANTVVIECATRLVKLFERSFGVRCYPDHESLIKDCQPTAYVPMATLPRLLGGNPPLRRSDYIVPDAGRVAYYRQRMEALGPGPYVGFSWYGGVKSTHASLRNAPPKNWLRLMEGLTAVSLQYGKAGSLSLSFGLPHWQEAIDDLDEFAALVKACDLVVTVCNTTVHMAGGVGTQCLVATPSKPAWRYGIKGPMPWYETVELVRQRGTDWDQVFAKLEQKIADFGRLQDAQRAVA